MPLVFSYGTLQDPLIQIELFGRQLQGVTANLQGFLKKENAVFKRYPSIVLSNYDRVDGVIFEMTDQELKICDAYETNAYKRKLHDFENHKGVWVYHADFSWNKKL